MNGHYVGSILGIKNSVHKKKLAVKAMDIVMFGPPKRKSWSAKVCYINLAHPWSNKPQASFHCSF